MEHQDWKTITINTKPVVTATGSKPVGNHGYTPGVANSNNASNLAGGIMVAEKKYKEDEFGMPITKGLPTGFSQRLIAARSEKGLTQVQLAALIGEKVQVIKDYEQNKVINVKQVIITKLEKKLGVSLRK